MASNAIRAHVEVPAPFDAAYLSSNLRSASVRRMRSMFRTSVRFGLTAGFFMPGV